AAAAGSSRAAQATHGPRARNAAVGRGARRPYGTGLLRRRGARPGRAVEGERSPIVRAGVDREPGPRLLTRPGPPAHKSTRGARSLRWRKSEASRQAGAYLVRATVGSRAASRGS